MAQFGRPIADITRGSWTTHSGATANLWATLDEATPDDADFVQSTVTAPITDFVEVRLSPVPKPLIKRGHILRVRMRKHAAAGNERGATVELRQGASLVIASFPNASLTALWPTIPLTLTPEQADLITDYADLRVRSVPTGATGGSGSVRRSVQISFVQLRVPDSTFGAVEDTSTPGVWRYVLGGVTGEGSTREDALVDLFTKLREIATGLDKPLREMQWTAVYYGRKIRDYTALRQQIATNPTPELLGWRTQAQTLARLDFKLANFDLITTQADTDDGG